jgi:uncharacterized membrane protein
MRIAIGTVVGVLALLGIAASVGHYFVEPYNPGFLEFPAITNAHVILGAVFLAFAPLQFVGQVRARALGYHRWAGRLLVAVGLVVGATALFLGLVVPFSGNGERLVIGLFGGLFLASLVKGVVHIGDGQVAAHRAWMMRAFAIGLSIATMRLVFIPALVIAGNPTDQQIAVLSNLSFTVAFVLHVGVAELWLRRGGARRVAPRVSPSTA